MVGVVEADADDLARIGQGDINFGCFQVNDRVRCVLQSPGGDAACCFSCFVCPSQQVGHTLEGLFGYLPAGGRGKALRCGGQVDDLAGLNDAQFGFSMLAIAYEFHLISPAGGVNL